MSELVNTITQNPEALTETLESPKDNSIEFRTETQLPAPKDTNWRLPKDR